MTYYHMGNYTMCTNSYLLFFNRTRFTFIMGTQVTTFSFSKDWKFTDTLSAFQIHFKTTEIYTEAEFLELAKLNKSVRSWYTGYKQTVVVDRGMPTFYKEGGLSPQEYTELTSSLLSVKEANRAFGLSMKSLATTFEEGAKLASDKRVSALNGVSAMAKIDLFRKEDLPMVNHTELAKIQDSSERNAKAEDLLQKYKLFLVRKIKNNESIARELEDIL
jgi:hypothetical protein